MDSGRYEKKKKKNVKYNRRDNQEWTFQRHKQYQHNSLKEEYNYENNGSHKKMEKGAIVEGLVNPCAHYGSAAPVSFYKTPPCYT